MIGFRHQGSRIDQITAAPCPGSVKIVVGDFRGGFAMLEVKDPIVLGPFRVDLASTRLLRDGVELDLRPRAFRALKVLIHNPGRLVNYQQMIDEAWDGTHVSKHTVAVTIGEIKHVLGEYGS